MLLLALVLLLTELATAPPSSAQASPEVGTANWRAVSAGGVHTCGIRTTGRLYCWGRGSSGAIGTGGNGNEDRPTEVAGGGTDWRSVSTGTFHTCARRGTGHLWCFGYDQSGQLGDGGTSDQFSPVEVLGTFADWRSVSAGGNHTCGIRANRRLYCWGADQFGQLGDGGTNSNQPAPAEVAGNHADWTAVSAGFTHTCARRSNGRLYCWGRDLEGQVGNGPPFSTVGSPALVAGGFTNWSSVAAGGYHTCARRANGRAYCWGEDDDGEIGDGGGVVDRNAPRLVGGGFTNWTMVTAGLDHSCGRRANGRAYCWGKDFDGQVGRAGGGADRTTPGEVAGGATTWTTVSAGQLHTCARRANARIWCWGYNASGQLGIGTTGTARQTPVEVSS
jgi:alpha-tubulin suppressor-like RCC1 family protein